MTAPWLDDRKPPNVRMLTLTELLALFEAHRNGLLAVVASAEVCRRMIEERRNDRP